ncbi:MAG: hypothetical protein IH912_01165 [Proteobacteria bacterium]|nr:hypothetical protein [Pseudomonadota bacterium]MCH8301334.1 hypothetical protein [Pseudomonadota bacterium]
MFKTFISGILLGLVGAGVLTYSVPAVDLHREPSLMTVQANGGNSEIFRIDLPRDRILVGLVGTDNALPAGLEWPGDELFGNLQAEMFKIRDRNDVVIGVASRLANASEETGPFIEWVLHLPARGTVYLQMNLAASAEGHRSGRMIAGTRDFETLTGTVRERFITDIENEDFSAGERIELITTLIGQLGDEE